VIPPWQKFPEIPFGSIGWRMEQGEQYWKEFSDWFARKQPQAKQRYADENPEPAEWRGFYTRKMI
jgi:hypothetical protein